MGELLQHQAVHGAAQQGGLELFLLPLHIAAVDDGGDDGRIGRGTANAIFLQRLDQGRFGVAGGGLGEFLLTLQLLELEQLALFQRGQAGLLLFLFIGGFLVQHGKAIKSHSVAAGLEAVVPRIHGHAHGILLAVCHLAGHKAAPDHPVELGGIAADALVHLVRGQPRHRGTDGFVGILRGGRALGLPGALVGADILFAVSVRNILLCSGDRLIGDAQAVGTHIGDQTHGAVARDVHAFVQGLGGTHGTGSRKAQTAGGLLLQGTGDKGRGGLLGPLAFFQFAHGILGTLQTLFDGTGLCLVFGQQLFAGAVGGQAGGKALVAGAQRGIHVPVFLGLEVLDLLLAVIDQPHRHALDTARRQAPAHLPPQEGAELIAHQTVEDAASLLGVEQVLINGTGIGHALLHALFGDLVKGHAVGLVGVQPQDIGQMPADGFALTVRVGCQQNAVGLLGFCLELLDELGFIFDIDVLGGVVMFHVDAQLGLRQVPDMAHAGRDLVILAQIFANGLRLCRRLHDYQFCHGSLLLYYKLPA